MKIIDIQEKIVPISSEIKNAYISFAKMDCSGVAIKTDVKVDGENVVGYGFHSNGRYAVSELLTKRFIPRLKEAEEKELLNDDGTNFSPEKIWKVLMQNEKPGGHGERSTAVGTIDMAVWDVVSKIARVPLYEHLAKEYGDGKFTNKIFVYAAGGYYYPGKDIQMLQDEMKSYLDLGFTTVKMKIGGASLKDDINRIETGFYSTTENSIFELNRMVVIGKVGQILLDYSDDIIACWNKVVGDFKEDIDKARKALWAKEAEIRDHEKEIRDLKNAELSKKLVSEGIQFEVDEENLYRLPQLDVRFDWTVKNIRSMRILDKTKSGKSADIELGTIHKTYNSDKGEYELVFRNNKYERVRMDKIEYVLFYNKEKIV